MDTKINKLKLIFFVISLSDFSWASTLKHQMSDDNWAAYKENFNKTYDTPFIESFAKRVYTDNLRTINSHNIRYENKEVSYSLAPNQFTDRPLAMVQLMFPKVEDIETQSGTYKYQEYSIQNSYDITKDAYKTKVRNQGMKCNSGWAHAAATALESCLKQREPFGQKSVSAQQIIDCAGGDSGCSNQHQLTAYTYIKKEQIFSDTEYPNTPLYGQGTCKKSNHPNNNGNVCKTLYNFYSNDTKAIKRWISRWNYPVSLEFNEISFEFLHYSEGIFTPNPLKNGGSHFMVIFGYDKDSKGIEYWKLQNSFGDKWGENGYIRIAMGSTNLGTYSFSLA